MNAQGHYYNHTRALRTMQAYELFVRYVAVAYAGPLDHFPPTKAFSSTTPTVALEGRNASIRCFFYGK